MGWREVSVIKIWVAFAIQRYSGEVTAEVEIATLLRFCIVSSLVVNTTDFFSLYAATSSLLLPSGELTRSKNSTQLAPESSSSMSLPRTH